MDDNYASVVNHESDMTNHEQNSDDSGWQTVSYRKRNRKAAPLKPQVQMYPDSVTNGVGAEDVFQAIEAHAEERRRKLLESRAAALAVSAPVVTRRSTEDSEDEDSDVEFPGVDVSAGEAKKVRQKKPKKPMVTVAEAAARMDARDLDAFLADITATFETLQDIQLMRFTDYFVHAFASVSAAQFPWVKMFKESTVAKLVDIPLNQIHADIYKKSIDWISKRSVEALSSFVSWLLGILFDDLSSHFGFAKGSKQVSQPASSKSQVAIFLVLAMVMQRKPDALFRLMIMTKDCPKYSGQDNLPLIVWLISQASEGDLSVGLYLWVHVLLPVLSSKSGYNPQSRDLVLQLVERIFSVPKSRTILVNGAVRKGERLVPPWALDILMRLTFPATRIKETERLEAIYPTLKEIGLAGSSGSKAVKQLALQLSSFAIKAAGEETSQLSNEGSDIFVWCLTQNHECYKNWDKLYLDNLQASVVILKKMSTSNVNLDKRSLEPLKKTIQLNKLKNKSALANAEESRHSLLKESDKYCKVILRRRGNGCVMFVMILSLLALIAIVLSQNVEYLHSLNSA